MKVCNKCKKKVTNKTKICNRCGADVSKCKIIKNPNQNKNTKPKKIEEKKQVKINDEQKIIVNESKISKETETKKIIDKQNDKKKKETLKEKIKNVNEKKSKSKKEKPIKIKKEKTSKEKMIKIKKEKTPKEKPVKIKKEKTKRKTLITKKKLIIFLIVITTICMIAYGSLLIYKNFTKEENKIVEGEKATNEKLFAMGDIITYEGVNYQVLSVETSEGNSYKKPKEGNEFVIVTIQYENNTENKIKYSYKNWTMSNSKDEEEKRIFTSINVDTALYSGELVVGGIKRGSMVFEQPKNDEKLKLNFYELKTNKDKTEEIDKDKKIFSVSLKIPKEIKKVSKTENNE